MTSHYASDMTDTREWEGSLYERADEDAELRAIARGNLLNEGDLDFDPNPTYTCPWCQNSGMVQVSLADAENGPTDDPADEVGYDYCDQCRHGERVMTENWERQERMTTAMFTTDKQVVIEYLIAEHVHDKWTASLSADQDLAYWHAELNRYINGDFDRTEDVCPWCDGGEDAVVMAPCGRCGGSGLIAKS
jgi:hypothetical protein